MQSATTRAVSPFNDHRRHRGGWLARAAYRGRGQLRGVRERVAAWSGATAEPSVPALNGAEKPGSGWPARRHISFMRSCVCCRTSRASVQSSS